MGGAKGKGGGEDDIRGEPDGAEQVQSVEESPEENEALQQVCVNNNVIKDDRGDLLQSACGMSCTDKINRLEYIPYGVCIDDDEGTPVDPVDRYPQTQVNDEAK